MFLFSLKEILFAAIHMHWKAYQQKLLAELKTRMKNLVVTGDARHDSMGYNAKFGIYTIFCSDSSQIIDFSVVQVSPAR